MKVQTVADAIAAQLADEIRSGQLLPGERLRQDSTAERLHTSTTPVREAFSILERDGLVERTPHRGVVVFAPSLPDLTELYEMRIVLEGLAAEKAGQHMTGSVLENLHETFENLSAAAERSLERIRYHDAFHAAIYSACGRPRLARTVANLAESSRAYTRLVSTANPNRETGGGQHRAIYEACIARDGAAAGDAMRAHLQRNLDLLVQYLESGDGAEVGRDEAAGAALAGARLLYGRRRALDRD
jgi:DNA-binding GntR family transcriptional regulator